MEAYGCNDLRRRGCFIACEAAFTIVFFGLLFRLSVGLRPFFGRFNS
jgi:hypothetical protein